MRFVCKIASLFCSISLIASFSYGATITGTVKGPDGAAFRGAFVRAENAKTRVTVNVLSDKDGRYRVENLPAGEYQVRVKAVGYTSEPRRGVNLTAQQNVSLDLALLKGMVHWADLSIYQAQMLLPEGKGKKLLFGSCFGCHGFQTRMASTGLDITGWENRVRFMREFVHFSLGSRFTDQNASDLVPYLNTVFGVDSELPRSPAALPGYASTVHQFDDEAMKIVYVDYELPGPNRLPWSAFPYKDGNIWMPLWENRIARLDPKTGEVQEWTVPYEGTSTLAIHSAAPGPDGTVWFTEQATNKIGKWDPNTQKITEYPDVYTPEKGGLSREGSKHTVRIDANGYVWATGNPLSRLDPKTGNYTHFPEVPDPYSLDIDKNGNVWFTDRDLGKIGKVDTKSLKLTLWSPPTAKAAPWRIVTDSNGNVWFGEYTVGKIGRFDPKTETFKEYTLPGPTPNVRPFAIGIDKNKNVWYSSYDLDVIGCLDPNTGHVTEYPQVQSENLNREFFLDSQGRTWFASASNNKVGYFYLAGGDEHTNK